MRMKIMGGSKLEGTISVSGSKNGAGPLIAASILCSAPVRFSHVPRLTDVQKLLDILESMGAILHWEDEHTLTIDPRDIDPVHLDEKKMKSMRFSILLLGPLLARFQEVIVPEPGGCSIGNRSIETHLLALEELGARTERDATGLLHMRAKRLLGKRVVLTEFSVTATENVIMVAVLAEGTTTVHLAAMEPHVQDLCHFLNASGARISGIGTHDLTIVGVAKLLPPETWRVVSDANEAATFAIASILTHGSLRIQDVIPEHLDATLSLLRRIGVSFEMGDDWIQVLPVASLKAFRLKTMIYPGFPTDNQAPFGLLATQCQGTTLIHDPLFESRLGYLNELAKMGANVIIADPHRAVVHGPTPLYGTELRSLDLRAGATMILAALIAEGETTIHDAEMVYRGYEALDTRLASIGADITCLG